MLYGGAGQPNTVPALNPTLTLSMSEPDKDAATDAVREAVRAAIRAGVTAHSLSIVVAEEGSWLHVPAIVAISIRHSGRATQMQGIRIGACNAIELRYVDGRWTTAASFYSPMIGAYWVQGLEKFIRRLSNPIIVGRHPARDYRLMAYGFAQQSHYAAPPMMGCPSHKLSKNGEFPAELTEVPSFLNVMAITPQFILARAAPLDTANT